MSEQFVDCAVPFTTCWRRTFGALAVAALVFPLGAGQLQAEALGKVEAKNATTLRLIPKDALGFVHVQGLSQLKLKTGRLLASTFSRSRAYAMIRQIMAVENGLLQGRRLDGLERDGSLCVVILDVPRKASRDLKYLILARVKNFDTFRLGFLSRTERATAKSDENGIVSAKSNGKAMHLFGRKSYAVVTNVRSTADALHSKLKAAEGVIADSKLLPGETVTKILASDVGAWVNLATINKRFGDDISDAHGTFQRYLLSRANEQGTDKNFRRIMQAIFKGALKFLSDSRAALVTAKIQKTGISVHAEIRLVANSGSGKALAGTKLLSLSEIGWLPRGTLSYSAHSPVEGKLAGPVVKAFKRNGLSPGSPETVKEVDRLLATAATRVILAAESNRMFAKSLHAEICGRPENRVRAELLTLRAMSSVKVMKALALKVPPTVKRSVRKYRGFEFHRVDVELDLDGVARNSNTNAAALKQLGILERHSHWIGAKGKLYVDVTAGSWNDARSLLDGLLDKKKMLNDSPGFRDARNNLPKTASMIFFEDINRYYQTMAMFSLYGTAAKFNIPRRLLPKIPAPSTKKNGYYGLAFTLSKRGVDADLWIPTTMLSEYDRVMAPIFEELQRRADEERRRKLRSRN